MTVPSKAATGMPRLSPSPGELEVGRGLDVHPASAAEDARALKSMTLRSIFEQYAQGIGEFHDLVNHPPPHAGIAESQA